MSTFLRTSDLAKELGVHVNTIRIYEASGFLSSVSRGPNGYRQYCAIHLEQARLAHLALRWPYVGNKQRLLGLVKSAASGDLGEAMELAHEYLVFVRAERTHVEAAVTFLQHWATGQVVDTLPRPLPIRQAAAHLNVSVDMLRNWERNGLVTVPRDPANQYRLYGSAELGRLRVIRLLVKRGFSLIAILRMLRQFDQGNIQHLREALHVPRGENVDEANRSISAIADRWLANLLELELRAQQIIEQIDRLIAMHSSGEE